LVDNSIEAKAKNIQIFIKEKEVTTVRTINLINEIAVFDDGTGMDAITLEQCLSLGWGTRLKNAVGLGKFGFGLKGASIAYANRLEVYSWSSAENVLMTYLDYDEVVEHEIDELPDLQKVNFPKKYLDLIGDIPNSGTLVVWKKIDMDRLKPKQSKTLIEHLNKDMCRIFRHFLDDNDIYGTHRDIRVRVIDPKNEITEDLKLRANDPLYLLKPNNLPGFEKEDTNILNDEKKISISDPYGVIRTVHVLSSIARPEIQLLGGSSEVGKHYGANNGITFVRAGRELELGIKGFFANSEPRHRWHGIEVRFDPQLDGYFGVPNNKQGVRNFKNFDESELRSLDSEIENSVGKEKYSAEMLKELHKTVVRMIRANEGVVKSRGASRKTPPNNGLTTAGKVSGKLKSIEPNERTTSSEVAGTKTYDEKLEELTDSKMVTDTSLSYSEANTIAKKELGNMLHIEESEWPGSTFLDVAFRANAAIALVNRKHPFFGEFYDILNNSDDQKGFEALKIFLMAFARTEDTLGETVGTEDFEKIRDKWGYYMKELAQLSS
jgi:hypothetical protein